MGFDFEGNGQFQKVPWTDPNYGNAWLALDRNGNGRVDNATELFGNLTPQPKTDHPNGYVALAEYDKAENGGNGDGFIDAHDAVYSKLWLWVDINHDGISQSNELHTMKELGVSRIDLQFQEAQKTDQYGNVFRYRARVWDMAGDHENRWTYDVFFK